MEAGDQRGESSSINLTFSTTQKYVCLYYRICEDTPNNTAVIETPETRSLTVTCLFVH